MFELVHRVLSKYLQEFHVDGALFYSKASNSNYYKVGATFSSYEYLGNTITFKCDRTLTREYNMPFAMCLDFTGGKTTNTPPISLYSLKGKDLMISNLYGPGLGHDVVSTMVAGGAMTAMG